MRQAAPILRAESRETFWRTLQTFAITRTVIVVVLLGYVSLNAKKGFWQEPRILHWEICIIYLALALLFLALTVYCRRRFLLQVVVQIAVDIAAISVLYVVADGAKSGLAILYLFPLAGGAILAPLVLAWFFVSAVTFVLLAENGYQFLLAGSDTSISQAGLYGAAFFVVIFAINRLAAKLIKQESLAAQRGHALRVQQAINRLIIADMEDGILVVARNGAVLTGNPAAERMLGLAIPYDKTRFRLTDIPSLQPIADAFIAWRARSAKRSTTQAGSPTFVLVKPGGEALLQSTTTLWGGRREPLTHLKLRFVKVDTDGLTEDRTVIFMQDVTEIENQAQQLKLASMGRLTASIAHEVRNPLSAISYAASLLSEESPNASQSRLLNIVGDNVARLNRMIEDILKLSRKAHQHHEPIALAPLLADILAELHDTQSVPAGAIELGDMARCSVRFDPLHLREVLMNLLSNALRYASGQSGSIRIYIVSDAGNRLELHVQDDGPPIAAAVRAHLFEPFYTTSSKGTGLGLYLARELCLNNGAMLNYEYGANADGDEKREPSGRFVITFAVVDPH